MEINSIVFSFKKCFGDGKILFAFDFEKCFGDGDGESKPFYKIQKNFFPKYTPR